VVVREFNLKTLEFVSVDPFILPECKSRVSYKSVNTLLIGTDLKDGNSMTDSGFGYFFFYYYALFIVLMLIDIREWFASGIEALL